MSQTSPSAAGYSLGSELSPVGRATRWQCSREGDTSAFELWRLPRGADAIADRLVALESRRVGGFLERGDDADGPWVTRRIHRSLEAWLEANSGPVAWQDALHMVTGLADSLHACEATALHAGALAPSEIEVLEDGSCQLRADALAHGLLGATTETGPASARWMAPEQAKGHSSSSADNRYVVGLILYRLLAGEHPFRGLSLRKSLSERAERGAPPFEATIAESLPPGLQAFCLRLLSPDASERPKSSEEIASRLRSFLVGPTRIRGKANLRVPRFESSLAKPETLPLPLPQTSRDFAGRGLIMALGILGGVAAAGLAIASIEPRSDERVAVAPRAPLEAALSVADCETCHPRQASEWERSVMAHSAKSPLFQSLEMLIEEQVGKSRNCPDGAGILRAADPSTACRNPATGHAITGAGGELWCVNCHAPGENLRSSLPAWDGTSPFSSSRLPLRDLLPESSMEGIGCGFCHQVVGPVRAGNQAVLAYEGNPSWRSFVDGEVFSMRPEDRRGLFGIANSGYLLRPLEFLAQSLREPNLVPGGAHKRTGPEARAYLRSSEFCGSCHDVRLFGSDVIGSESGEHFKRLRNAYSEWAAWSRQEIREGRVPASCQDCHMSTYPGVCEPGAGDGADGLCPQGTVFSPRAPGEYASASASAGSALARVTNHYFSGVDVPLSKEFPLDGLDDETLDGFGVPQGARQRRDILLKNTFRLEVDRPRVSGANLEIPIEFENTGAGHRVPAGFSQEREVWIHLRVTDGSGKLVYEVGRVGRGDEDLADKIFIDVNTSDETTNRAGQPLGLFGANIIDGPDLPAWDPVPGSETEFRGSGLVNLQNGFLRCVRCIGTIDSRGECQPGPGQGRHRADRYADGDYDIDTGECRSNLRGENALFEVFFPVGALDAQRGVVRGPDAIVDDRSAPPGVPVRYTYEIPRNGSQGPYQIEARLMFRAFPPFLLRAFADYELGQERRGRRPNGPLLRHDTLERLEAVEIERASSEIP